MAKKNTNFINNAKLLGSRIKYFRKLNNLTQEALSEKIDCEISTLAHIETGKNLPSMSKVFKIADVLNIEPYQLFIESEPAPDENIVAAINKLLPKADNIQLRLIYDLISRIIDLFPKK